LKRAYWRIAGVAKCGLRAGSTHETSLPPERGVRSCVGAGVASLTTGEGTGSRADFARPEASVPLQIARRARSAEGFALQGAIAILSVLPWGGSSIGRAPRSHRGGCEFDPHPLHLNRPAVPAGLFISRPAVRRASPLFGPPFRRASESVDRDASREPAGLRAPIPFSRDRAAFPILSAPWP
jgi:hypothetical protein